MARKKHRVASHTKPPTQTSGNDAQHADESPIKRRNKRPPPAETAASSRPRRGGASVEQLTESTKTTGKRGRPSKDTKEKHVTIDDSHGGQTEEAEGDVEDEAPPPKRKRGRPKKISIGSTDVQLESAEADPPKRGPGRPKKTSNTSMKSTTQAETPKRGPGRPRKDSNTQLKTATQEPPKRGPGRPKKHSNTPLKPAAQAEAPKRGPGRPKKDSHTPMKSAPGAKGKVPAANTAAETPNTGLRRGRSGGLIPDESPADNKGKATEIPSRKRKAAASQGADKSDAEEQPRDRQGPPKRGRGRPRKRAVSTADAKDDIAPTLPDPEKGEASRGDAVDSDDSQKTIERPPSDTVTPGGRPGVSRRGSGDGPLPPIGEFSVRPVKRIATTLGRHMSEPPSSPSKGRTNARLGLPARGGSVSGTKRRSATRAPSRGRPRNRSPLP